MKEKVVNTKTHKIKNWANNPSNYNSRIVQIYLKKSDENSGVDKDVFLAEIRKQDIPEDNYVAMRTNSGNSNGHIFQGTYRITMSENSYEEVLKHF